MTVYYESRVRPTVLVRWVEDKDTYPGSITTPDTLEGADISGSDFIFRDMKIPISYKTSIARELWEEEDEVIKREIRLRRESDPVFKTVYNTEGKERLELIHEYVK